MIEEDIYDDINTGIPEPVRPPKPCIPQPTEPELIIEDTYDDVEQLAETVKLQLGKFDCLLLLWKHVVVCV